MVAPIVIGVPASIPVNVAVYVPSPLSVVLPIVPVLAPSPVEVLKATVSPVVFRLRPAASLAWSVSMAVEPDATVDLEVVTEDWAAETVTVIVGCAVVTGVPPIVALIVVAVPA